MFDKVTNIEYLYIARPVINLKQNNSGELQPSDDSSNMKPCCKDCSNCYYNLTRNCMNPDQDDSKDINLFIERLKARLQGRIYENLCTCHKSLKTLFCDCEEQAC